MPKTEAKIKKTAKNLHNELSRQYYELKTLDKEEFDRLHREIWSDMDAELIAADFREPRRDLKAEYLDLVDIKDNVDFMAEILGLK